MDQKSKWQNILDRCEHGKGWHQIVAELMDGIEAVYRKHNLSIEEDFSIGQVKQKFGELTVYYKSNINEEIRKLVQNARLQSTQTCEECGKVGRMYKIGHCCLASLCRDCAEILGFDTSDESGGINNE